MPNSRFALHGLCALFVSNSRFVRLLQAARDTCLDSPFFASLSVHGVHLRWLKKYECHETSRKDLKPFSAAENILAAFSTAENILAGTSLNSSPRIQAQTRTRVFATRVCRHGHTDIFLCTSNQMLLRSGQEADTLQSQNVYAWYLLLTSLPNLENVFGAN